MPRVSGSVAMENVTSSDVPMLYLTPRDESNAPVSSDGELVSAGNDDDIKCAENMQPSHASEATPRRSARLSVAKQHNR